MVLNDAPEPVEPHVFLRGNPGRPGKAVPAAVPQGPGRPGPHAVRRRGAAGSSWPRRSPSPKNPLTARVMVNRVWHCTSARGWSTTPSDFGLRSDPPSHPELLDYLAAAFVDGGWSIKALHRRIMLSSTYQQRSDPRPDVPDARPGEPPALAVQPPPARLRGDARRAPGRRGHARPDRRAARRSPINEPPFPPRRTVYGFIDRQNLDGVFRTFDFAGPTPPAPSGSSRPCPSRPSS